MKQRILIVDDEEDLCEILEFNLENEGYDIDTAYSGEEALKLIEKDPSYSLILLDVMMGGISGFKMASIARNELNINIPIIFLTAKDTENDMLTGFSIGADDYISKPYSIKELIARVKAALRRSKVNSVIGNTLVVDNIIIDNLKINLEQKEVSLSNVVIQLTRKEFDILVLFAKNPGRIYSRQEILDKIWGQEQIVSDRTVDVHITRLRKKLENFGNNIVNRSNYGYCLKA